VHLFGLSHLCVSRCVVQRMKTSCLPYFLFSVPFLTFRYHVSVFRSKEIAEYPNTFFHVMMVIVAVVVTIVVCLIFTNFLIGCQV